MKNLSFKEGFSLAEAIIVLTLMGLIAAIIIPSSISRTTEKTNKAKVRKALTTYQALIEQAIIENNLNRSVEVVDGFFTANNCEQAHKYFKMIKTDPASSCKFLSTDKLWWDLSQGLSRTIIAQKNDAQNDWLNDATARDDETHNAFYLVYSFDKNGAVRVNDLGHEKTTGSDFNKCSIEKQEAYINGQNYIPAADCTGFHNGGGGDKVCFDDVCEADPIRITRVCRTTGTTAYTDGSWGSGVRYCMEYESCFEDSSGTRSNCITYSPEGEPSTSGILFNGGYYCLERNGGFECHINGSQVPDIRYDINGNVVGKVCNHFSGQKGNCDLAIAQCKTALCDWVVNPNEPNGGHWESNLKGADYYQARKLVCLFVKSKGGHNEECDNLTLYP